MKSLVKRISKKLSEGEGLEVIEEDESSLSYWHSYKRYVCFQSRSLKIIVSNLQFDEIWTRFDQIFFVGENFS